MSQDVSVAAFRAPGTLEPRGSYIDHFFPGRLTGQFHVRRMELLPEVLRGSHDLTSGRRSHRRVFWAPSTHGK